MDFLTKMMFINNIDNNINVVQLIYCSNARVGRNCKTIKQNISNIVNQSRIRNPSYNITGALLSDGKFFAQVVEGPPNSVRQLYSNIVYDKRHANVILLQYVVINVRLFHRWPMAYVDVDELSHVDKLSIQSTPAELRKACVSILKSFRAVLLDET